MSTIARVTAPILLILAAYIGGGAELMLQHSIAGTGDAVWISAILIAGLANLASVLWLQRDASARSLTLWGLLLKLGLLPLYIGFLPFAALLAACLMAPPYLVLAIGYLFTLICGMYAVLLTSSQYGIAAAHRAYTEGLLSLSSKRRHIAMHCLPFADLISSIWLCILLHQASKPASAAASES
ncbi:MAG: hypothetical protein KHZ63_05610 [Actinomyces sp.]|nr:hypothetical protein [Actinomyces sp.]